MKNHFFLLLILCLCSRISAQVITREDSLNAGLTPKSAPTVISGYGQAKVEYDLRSQTGTANLTRNVMFFGHRFTDKLSFFSELEIENAKVANGSPAGEISMEQLFLKFNLNRNHYLTAGLIIPRIGIINENHLPTTFHSNDRPYVETLVIPATWRELGIGFYGFSYRIPGLNYSLALLNGLNSAGFRMGTGISDGRFEGQMATASNLAVTGAVLYYFRNFRFQVSSYYGGSAGLTKRNADSLKLNYGAFGTPVSLSEANVQYFSKGFEFKVLGTIVSIPDADRINRAYASNTPEMMIGAYAEIGYNILNLFKQTTKRLTAFVRCEYMDLNYKTPVNGIEDDFQKKEFITAGLHFQPARGVSVKLDYVFRQTGQFNPKLYIANPYVTQQPFYTTTGFVNLGIGYSF
ncbi:MAG: hypothetical protein ACXVP0_01850 [Bacteroidia bacterium]